MSLNQKFAWCVECVKPGAEVWLNSAFEARAEYLKLLGDYIEAGSPYSKTAKIVETEQEIIKNYGSMFLIHIP